MKLTPKPYFLGLGLDSITEQLKILQKSKMIQRLHWLYQVLDVETAQI